MYLKVRSFVSCPNGKSETLMLISKQTIVGDLKTDISKEFEIERDLLRLFYLGKELNDSYKVYNYGIKLNEVVQFIIKSSVAHNQDLNDQDNGNSEDLIRPNEDNTDREPAQSKYYRVGDQVDAKDQLYGAWFEARIVEICKVKTQDESANIDENDLIFKIKFEKRLFQEPVETSFAHIRPRSKIILKFMDIQINDVVLINYNIEEPEKQGFWYDLLVTKVKASKTKRELEGVLYVGMGNSELENVKIKMLDQIYKIENPVLLTEREGVDEDDECSGLRKEASFCTKCKDNIYKKCKSCGCSICGGKEEPEKMLMCDECDWAYHLKCLNPPLEKVPEEDEWYCPECKTDVNEIVKVGDELKSKKRKPSLGGSSSNSSRDWGRGMACVSRTKICTIVPSSHYGPIPGIEVGMCWKFRMQVSECGVHRPHVAGIHGRENDGAYSLVLSGGYEDDYDDGETFYYTGSGGRDLSGNKRTAQQSCDQTLTRMNKALALNCNIKLNQKGSEAIDWRAGKPVRVVRNYKIGKHSKFAPEDGNRYDGIYKVVKYWPSKGKSGFVVWRYLLQRDDPDPAPWEKNAKKFEMIYPDGYLEVMKVQEEKKIAMKINKKKKGRDSDEENLVKKKGIKRKNENLIEPSLTKKKNLNDTEYKLPDELNTLIQKDKSSGNDKYWEQCEIVLPQGKAKFLSEVEEVFKCICCQELVFEPIMTPCFHIFCNSCLERSFAADLKTCPHCRDEIPRHNEINKNLTIILKQLFPGYEVNRF